MMRYRPDIDGLRAVAVIPVVLFHAGIGAFSGGFIGVDVFFVISGYLITALIAADIREGRFSIAEFYERRIRRLLPALVAMLLFSSAAASLILLPNDFRLYSQSLLSALFSVSNIFFWRQSGYFSEAAELQPLLHTWSLSVEEQFYVVLPVSMLLLHRYLKGRWIPVLALAAALSFGLSVWLVTRKPDIAFYLIPTRAWELLLGSLLALGAVPAFRSRMANEAGGLLGLGLIGWSVASFTSATAFPGLNALYPCLGAALLIHTGGMGTVVGRLLSLAPIVFVGAISYSLYLWHWPLIVFTNYYSFGEMDGARVALLLAATFGLAVLSWRFVEKPFRHAQGLLGGRRAFAHAGVAMALFAAFGAYGTLTQGWGGRYDPRVVELDAYSTNRYAFLPACHDRKPADVDAGRLCVIGAKDVPDADKDVWLFWGDSHAAATQDVYDDVFRSIGKKAIVAAYHGCVPLFGLQRVGYPEPCYGFNESVKALIAKNKIKNVVITAYWTGYYHDTDQIDLDPTATSGRSREAILDDGITRTLTALDAAGVNIHLTDPLPGARHFAPRAMAASVAWKRPVDQPFSLAEFQQRNEAFFRTVQTNASHIRSRLSLWKTICQGDVCPYEHNGLPIYFDNNHPSRDNFEFAKGPIASFLEGNLVAESGKIVRQ
ncbi:acyltransferase family protein [Azospirillum doebereinerae]|uniref:acyltransferase family protein n=1 Tax=Azospirillum doebereinerae TaxID=92933 RepID=UPI001EE63430|nr:acyltransferase family protein [Azospirillum doebereinerae]MCG5240512.1 acyltransferase [Azospirillum doebereinerae]